MANEFATNSDLCRLMTGSAHGLSRERARAMALAAGFTEAGLVALPYAAEERDAERFREWVGAGRAGTMGYLKRKAGRWRLGASSG